MIKKQLLELDIQKFAETAANAIEDDSIDAEIADSNTSVSFTDGAPEEVNDDASSLDPIDEDVKPEIDEKKQRTKSFSERLKREREKIEQEADQKRLKDMDAIAAKRGFKNWKELEEFDKKEKLEAMGITDPDTFNSLISEAVETNPVVTEAKNIIENQKKKEQEEILKTSIKEINQLDGDIKTIDDIINLENYDEFYTYVEKGYTLVDAYKLFAFEKITKKQNEAATQKVMNSIDSKGHIKTTKGDKAAETVVPDEVMMIYRKSMPGMTEQQIREHYSKFLGGK